jgi:hypothetical protein
MVRRVSAKRYVTPLREGGSLPAIVEADDDGLYVMKFRGAGQGVKALIAELVVAGLACSAGLRVPEVVLIDLPPELGRNEPDQEIRDLLKASVGMNLGLDFLPGSAGFDPLTAKPPSAQEASAIVWFDAFVANVDRTAKNPNLLVWHRQLWLIDHGAALYAHHDWGNVTLGSAAFRPIRNHVLLPFASALGEADDLLRSRLTPPVLEAAVAAIPEPWLENEPAFAGPKEHRAAYEAYLKGRLSHHNDFLEEAVRAHRELV